MLKLFRDWPKLVLAIILANIALSAWSISLDSVINNDGITYLSMAEMFLAGDWQTAYSYYSWPFYPLLIAGLSKVFFINVTYAAYLLNTLLVTSACLAFVAIVNELSRYDRKTVLIAAIVILAFPSITKYRAFIIRDFGYLSFYLWSLYFIFQFCQSSSKKHLLAWLTTSILSCLFRFEGMIFLLVAPYCLFAFSNRHIAYRKSILVLLTTSITVAFVALISWYLQDKYSASLQLAQANGEKVNSIVELLWNNVSSQFEGGNGHTWAYISALAKNIGEVTYELIRRMAIFYFFIVVIAYWKNLGLTNKTVKQLWWVYVIINFAVLVGFSFANNLVVSRYTMATSLTLLLLAPFALRQLIVSLKQQSLITKFFSYALLVLISIASIEGLDVRTNKSHFLDAGDWMNQNIPKSASLYSNDRLLVHYANLGAKSNFVDQFNNSQLWSHIDSGAIKGYDFIALSMTPKSKFEDIMRQTLSYHFGRPIQIIEGQEKRAVFIFSTER